MKEQDLQKLENQAREAIQVPGEERKAVLGNVEVVAQNWRCNPSSGRVSEYIRLSYRINGKRVSRATLLETRSQPGETQ